MTGRLEHADWHAVGTTCSASVVSSTGERPFAREALAAARDEVAACERELSRFDAASDLSRLNAAGGRWVVVGPRLLEALGLALRARGETGGRFDPTVLPGLIAAGYDRSFEQLDERPGGRLEHWQGGAAIELDEAGGRARLAPGAAVDLGGIGKGYAAERALDAMIVAWPTLRGALVDLGGDLAVRGEPPGGGPWRIAVADPRRPGSTVGTLLLEAGGVATSGRDVRRFGPDGSLHHLIDPVTGAPAEPGPLSVTVVAPTAAEAEAHSTALAIWSAEEAAAHVAAHPRIAALYVPHEGAVLALGAPPLARPRIVVRAA